MLSRSSRLASPGGSARGRRGLTRRDGLQHAEDTRLARRTPLRSGRRLNPVTLMKRAGYLTRTCF